MTPRPGPAPPAVVWAVVVHFGDPASTAATLKCLAASTTAVRVIVVDNGRNWPGADAVMTVTSAANGGYAAGANQGIRIALEHGARHVWLLNNDTLPGPDDLGLLLETAAGAGPASIVGCRERDVAEGRREIGAVAPILPAGKSGMVRQVGPAGQRADFVSGFCLLISRDTVMTVGPFDEGFFHYFEDVDYSLRAISLGVDVVVDRRVVVDHRQGTSLGGESNDAAYYYLRNRLIFASRLTGRSPLKVLALMDAANGVRPLISVRRILARDWSWLRAAWSGTIHGLRGRTGPRPA